MRSAMVSLICCADGWRLVLSGVHFTIPAETEGEALASLTAGLASHGRFSKIDFELDSNGLLNHNFKFVILNLGEL